MAALLLAGSDGARLSPPRLARQKVSAEERTTGRRSEEAVKRRATWNADRSFLYYLASNSQFTFSSPQLNGSLSGSSFHTYSIRWATISAASLPYRYAMKPSMQSVPADTPDEVQMLPLTMFSR